MKPFLNAADTTIESFSLFVPTKIYFGRRIFNKALHEERQLLRGSVMLVTSPGMQKRGMIKSVISVIEEVASDTRIEVFSGITANPKVNEINEGINESLAANANTIIGFGGGSALDAAKAIAVGAGEKTFIDDYFFNGKVPGVQTLPVIAVPTTSGTGSELSKSAIVSCPERQMKGGVRGEAMYPRIAIVDPSLTDALPHKETMETGFDVFCHAVESYVSHAANPFTLALSEQALHLVSKYLPVLAKDLSNNEARDYMAYASMIMGINLGNASTALPHRMQYPIGALTDTSHAIGLAMLYPAWFSRAYADAQVKFDAIGSILKGELCTGRESVLHELLSFMKATCGLPQLNDIGFSLDDATKLTSMVNGNIALDPTRGLDNAIETIYRTALDSSSFHLGSISTVQSKEGF